MSTLDFEEGVLPSSDEEQQSLQQLGFQKCRNQLCNYHISPEVTDSAYESGQGDYTCAHCGLQQDLLKTPGQPGGNTNSGLRMDQQGQIGEDIAHQALNSSSYGPVVWWHHGGSAVNSAADGAVSGWLVEVKTVNWNTQRRRGIINTNDRGLKLQAVQNPEIWASQMKDPTLDDAMHQIGHVKGLLGVLVLLDFENGKADVFAREMPHDPEHQHGGIINFSQSGAIQIGSDIPFESSLPDPRQPGFVPFNQRQESQDPVTSSWKLGQTMYHHALPEDRESIEQQGLLPKSPGGKLFVSENSVYDPQHSDHWAFDPSGLDLKPVLREYDQAPIQGWYYTHDPISPEKIKRLASEKWSLDYTGPISIGESPQAEEDQDTQNWGFGHPPNLVGDETKDDPAEYKEYHKFLYANGQLHVSPDHDHSDLAAHAGVHPDHAGPMATGDVYVTNGRATWQIYTNIALASIAKLLKDYTKQVGWRWGGLTDQEGEPISDEFAPKKSGLANWTLETDPYNPHNMDNYRVVDRLDESVEDVWKRMADYPGGTDMTDRMKVHEPAGGEDLELKNLGDINKQDDDENWFPKSDDDAYRCKQCGNKFFNYEELTKHQLEKHPMTRSWPNEESKAPELPNMDIPLVPHFQTTPDFHEAGWKFADPQIMYHVTHPDDTYRQQIATQGLLPYKPHTGPDEPRQPKGVYLFDNLNDAVLLSAPGKGYYGLGGPPGDIYQVDVSGLPLRSDEYGNQGYSDEGQCWVHNKAIPPERIKRLAANQEIPNQQHIAKDPKDSFSSPIPFIYDVDKDHLQAGFPGQTHQHIVGDFSPGGIVQGMYEPGGKVTLQPTTNRPYTVYHLVDLWYHNHPHLEVTGVQTMDQQGKTKKLAQDPIQKIKNHAAMDPAVTNAYRALEQAGGKVHVVGGAVRDALKGEDPKDIDLMVTGLPGENTRRVLESLPGRVDLTGKDFGVFRYRHKGHEVEIALPRRERSTGEGHQDFDVQADHTMTPEEDLARRDFTVNAMAVPLSEHRLIDPFGGANDIRSGALRTIGPNSFRDDPLRVVRALTANARHGFEPDEDTRLQMMQNAENLHHLPSERIQMELQKIMSSRNPARAMRLAHETGVLGHILPEVEQNWDYDQNNPHHNFSLGEHSVNVLDNIAKVTNDPDLRLAALLHDIGKPASAWTDPETGSTHYYEGPNGEGAHHEKVGAQMAADRLRALKFPNSTIDRVQNLVNGHMYPDFSSSKGARRFINKYGDDYVDDLMTLREADREGKGTDEYQALKTPVDTQRSLVQQVREQGEPTDQSNLAINGNDLIQLGYTPGPALGQKLRDLTNAVVEDPTLNTRETLLEMASNGL